MLITKLIQITDEEHAASAVPAPVGGRFVLVVEDNEDARDMITEFLQILGHSVLAVGSAEEALGLLATAGLDVLLTDISLPQMSGVDLARHAQAYHPHLEVIFCTGHHRAHTSVTDPSAKFLLKPFSLAQLQGVLEATLD